MDTNDTETAPRRAFSKTGPGMANAPADPEADTDVVALEALAWILADEDRAERLLALTGLDPESLRAGLGDRAVLASLLGFLANHEPDLVACAEATGRAPGELADAARRMDGAIESST